VNIQKIDFKRIFAVRNRGILLDIVVFCVNLVLMGILTRLSMSLVRQADEDASAKLLIGLFFAGLFFLQPLGPILKRWSFHQTSRFDSNSTGGCLLFWFMFCYIVMMLVISGTAVIILTEAIFEQGSATAANVGPALVMVGFVLSIVNVVFIYRYFWRPKKEPRWKFLTTPQAALLGDLFMFLNVICLQLLWNCLTSAPSFWELMTSTPLGKPGSFTDILGRFILIGSLALLVYFPGRIFYLVEDKRRKITWLTMLLANLPLIVRAVFASHH